MTGALIAAGERLRDFFWLMDAQARLTISAPRLMLHRRDRRGRSAWALGLWR
jgi:hypothetical protein